MQIHNSFYSNSIILKFHFILGESLHFQWRAFIYIFSLVIKYMFALFTIFDFSIFCFKNRANVSLKSFPSTANQNYR